MNRKERVRAALAGAEVDRPPAATWGHDFFREHSPAELAASTIERYRRDGDDLIKLNPRATYYYEAWGSRYDRPDTQRHPRLLHAAVTDAAALAVLPEIDPATGPFNDQTESLRLVVAEVGDEVDVLQTLFNPLSVAGRLMGEDVARLRQAASEDPAAVHAGLATITRVLARYAAQSLAAGASGVFFATVDWGTASAADTDFYREFGRPYDLQVLHAVRGAPLNVLHVCRDRNMLPLLADYPVAVFNWDVHGEGNIGLAEGRHLTGKTVMGGVNQRTIATAGPEPVAAQARMAAAATAGRGVIIAPGCAIPPSTPAENIAAVLHPA